MIYAGFWRRALALIVDLIFVAIISMLLALFGISSYALGILIGFLYQPVFESSRLQGSPGKNLMGLKVTDLQGQRITFKAALIRYVVRFFSGLFLCLGYVMMLFNDKKQTFHDVVAHTLVIDSEVKDINIFQAWYDQVLSVLGMVDKIPAHPATGYDPGPATYSAAPAATATATATPADLAGLYDLFQKGILTEAEYNQKREELLKKL